MQENIIPCLILTNNSPGLILPPEKSIRDKYELTSGEGTFACGEVNSSFERNPCP